MPRTRVTIEVEFITPEGNPLDEETVADLLLAMEMLFNGVDTGGAVARSIMEKTAKYRAHIHVPD